MTENGTKPARVVRVDATLAERGDYLKLKLSDKQPPPADGYKNSWAEQQAIRSMGYSWRGDVESQLGRMHYEDYGDLLYPTIPVFEAFARAIEIDESPAEKKHTKYDFVQEPVDQEEIVKKLMESLKLQDIAMREAKKVLGQKFNEGLGEGDAIEAESEETSLNKAVEQLFTDLSNTLTGYVKLRAKNVKLTRKRRKATDVTEKVPHLRFLFKNGIEIHMEGQASELFSLLVPVIQRIKARMEQVRNWRASGVQNGDYDYEPKGEHIPMEHQKVMYKIHTLLDHSANLSQMGTGKSLAVVMAIDKRIQRGEVRPGHVLVICPATILDTWVNKHLRKGAPHLTGKIITGSYNERLEMITHRDGVDVFFTNFETFSMKSKIEINGKEFELALGNLFSIFPWDMVIIDEAHKVKNPNAQRTQNIIKAFREVPYSIIMSGTINANKLYDLHAPFVFLNGAKQFNSLNQERGSGELFGLSKLHEQFVNRYFAGTGWKKTPLPFTISELRERMEEISVRYEKKECFELPEKVYEQRMIEMGQKQAMLYNALKNFLAAQLADLANSGGTVTVMNLLAMMVKLAEAANGWIYDDNHELIDLPENPKRDAVMDVLADMGDDDKVIIWSRFTNDLHLIYDAIKKEYGEQSVAIIHGGESCSICGSRKDSRYNIMEKFNDVTSELKYVVVNSAVGSHGIDLTGATYEFFFSNSFVKTDRIQAEDRAHRWGMRDNLTIIDFVMKDTVDEAVLLALKSWKSMSAALLGHLGLDEKMFGAGDAQETPVIVEHIAQKPGECALATIAMLSSKSIELVRSWMTVQLGDHKKYSGQNEYVLLAVDHFLPHMKEQWAQYMADIDKAKISPEVKELPTSGTGAIIIRHEKSARIAHAIAYSNGFIYDPGRMGKVEREKYAAWMVNAKYNVEWVFTLPANFNMVLDEKGADNGRAA